MNLAEIKQSAEESKKDSMPTILVVEDSKSLNSQMQKALQYEGFLTDSAFSGTQAVTKIMENPYTLMTLDYMLPDMTGKDVIKQLARRKVDIPFIIVTGKGSENIAVEMMKMGARDYMVKDHGLQDILPHVIKRAIAELAKDKELANAQEALRESEERFRGIFDSADFCISLTDTGGGFTLFNSRTVEAFGYTPEELAQRTVLDITYPEDIEPSRKKMEMLVNNNIRSYSIENRYVRKDGSFFWAYASVSPIRGTDGEIQAISSIVVDITERKQMEEKLQRAHNELEQRVKARTIELSETVGRLEEQVAEREKAEKKIQLQLRRLNTLRSTERAITGSIDLRVTLDIILDQVTTQLGIDAASVLLLNEHTRMLEYVVSRGFRTSVPRHTSLKLGESHAGRAAINRCTVTIPDLKNEPDCFIPSSEFAAEDFKVYFAVPLIAKGQVSGVLELFNRAPFHSDPEWLEFLETIANQAAIAIDNASLLERIHHTNIELFLAYDKTIEGWSRAMDLRDKETEGHTQRVTNMTLELAHEIGIKQEELVNIKRGALLHDIGKMGIPDRIFLKPGPLTDEEWKIMKRHPEYAYEMLYPIEYLRPALDIPYCHHEKWDGTGYPRGLKGKDIPLSARIFALADVFDASCSNRPYRRACSKEDALNNIHSLAGTHFDPEIVKVFLKLKNITG